MTLTTKINKIVCAFLLVSMMTLNFIYPIYANENSINITGDEKDSFNNEFYRCGEVWSEPEYDGWKLTWESGWYYDTLVSAEKEGTFVKYEYDEVGNRISKDVNGKKTKYKYDEKGYLVMIENEDSSIEYLYAYDEKYNNRYIYGGIFNGEKFEFEYNDGIITGINVMDELVAKYIYSSKGEFLGTFTLNDDEWQLCVDLNNIGNVNTVRFQQMNYDEETGWYYCGRYYDSCGHRYIDGISIEDAEKKYSTYGIDSIIKSYDFGLPDYNPTAKSATYAFYSTIELIGRVIYKEAGTEPVDCDAVSMIIYNRMVSYNQSAYAVITAPGEFMAYENGSYIFESSTANSAKWVRCMHNADFLYNNSNIEIPLSCITSHKNFRSIKSFNEKFTESNGNLRLEYTDGSGFHSDIIKEIVLPNGITISSRSAWDNYVASNSLNAYLESSDNSPYNVYFKYGYE